jgi:hypothetical protein
MSKTCRLSVLAAYLAVAVAGAAPAGASYAPRLVVATNDPLLTITISQGSADSASAKWDLLIPPDYLVQGARNEGDAVASLSGKTAGGASMTGSLNQAVATTAVTVNGVASTMADQYTVCTGEASSGLQNSAVQYWTADAKVGGTSVKVPVFLSQIFPNKLYYDVAFYAMRICLPQSLALTELTLSYDTFWTASPGWYVWRLLATPYSGAAANPSGMVESQAIDRFPVELTLAAGGSLKDGSRLAGGRLVQGGRGVGGQTVELKVGEKVVGSAKTNRQGRYSAKLKLAVAAKVVAHAVVPVRSLPGCIADEHFAPSCVGATVAGFTAASKPLAVKL